MDCVWTDRRHHCEGGDAGQDPGGIIVTMLLGIVGALVGGFVGRSLGMYGQNQSAGVIMSIMGAVIVLLIYRLTIGKRGTV